MQNDKLITYIIANRNYGNYIIDALCSAKNQTVKCFVSVIEDNSSDDSWQKINKELFTGSYQDQYIENNTILIRSNDYAQAIKLPRQFGPSFARNLSIQLNWNNSQYFAILDADDTNYPTKIEKCINILENNPPVGLVYCDYNILNVDTGNVITEFKEPYSKIRLMQECIIHSGFVVRKEALEFSYEQTGFYDNRLNAAEDWDLELRISEKFLCYHIAEPLSLVRVHKKNSTNSLTQERWSECWRLVQQKLQQRHAKPR